MVGHRAAISALLFGICEGGLKAAVTSGSRSMLFVFERLGEDEEPMRFGAVIDDVIEGGEPGEELHAVVWFWADLAEVYATPGTEFDLWLGRVVGRGCVLEAPVDSLSR